MILDRFLFVTYIPCNRIMMGVFIISKTFERQRLTYYATDDGQSDQ